MITTLFLVVILKEVFKLNNLVSPLEKELACRSEMQTADHNCVWLAELELLFHSEQV